MKILYAKGKEPNFGDDLNAELWPALVPSLFRHDSKTAFLGIGTIIGRNVSGFSHVHIFSSGAGYDEPTALALAHTVWCVRGPLTAHVLGLPPRKAVTDGAILAPLATQFPAAGTRGGATVVIPHWESFISPGWEEAARLAGAELIDPRGAPADVIRRIATAGLVITESLHGAILADTYGIPWVAFATSGNFSVFKWLDWTMSVDVTLDVHSVPAPSAPVVLHHGKGPFKAGRSQHFTKDHAMAELRGRAAQREETGHAGLAGWLKQSGKSALIKHPRLQGALGFSPARTAERIAAVAKAAPALSRQSLRATLRDRMQDELESLVKHATVRA